jgi:hypothetical protein
MRLSPLLLVPLMTACTAIPQTSRPGAPPVARPPVANVPPTRPAAPPAPVFRAPEVDRAAGLAGVIEQDGASLIRRFGNPRLDVREGDMRKLQFTGGACVLDIYLYPLRPNAEPVATHVEARRASDGEDVDRDACIAALRRGR